MPRTGKRVSGRHSDAAPGPRAQRGTVLASSAASIDMESAMGDKNQGEGNREADRRYRRGVRETVRETTEEERAERARDLTPEELEAARNAEEQGKAKKRPSPAEKEI
jgi:hypothetical protein